MEPKYGRVFDQPELRSQALKTQNPAPCPNKGGGLSFSLWYRSKVFRVYLLLILKVNAKIDMHAQYRAQAQLMSPLKMDPSLESPRF